MNPEVRQAVRLFWNTRRRSTGDKGVVGDATKSPSSINRNSATSGKHLDGFVHLVRKTLIKSGIKPRNIFSRGKVELPGYFRAEKQWDVVAVDGDDVIAAVELKSQIGPSFGNNYNNRCEEAIGNALDFRLAWEDGAMSASRRPWLGYLMLLEDSEKAHRVVNVDEPHFPVLAEFHATSYTKRYGILLEKLVDQRLYDAGCLLLSPRSAEKTGGYRELRPSLGYQPFLESLGQHARAFTAR